MKLTLSARVFAAALFLSLAGTPAYAQLSIVGEWAGRYHEDQTDRVPGDIQGDFAGVPINEAARRYAEAYDVRRVNLLEHQCQPYSLPHIYRGPLQFRIWEEKHPDTQEIIAYKVYIGTYMQHRTIWMDGRAHPADYAPHTFAGFSTGRWNGDVLTVKTTHIKKEFYRRSGLPSSDLTTVTEHYIRHGNLLSHVMVINDPVYLTEPYVNSQEFALMERGNQNWLYNCEYVMEVPMDQTKVPHHLPGKNPFVDEFSKKFGLPLAAVWGGAETTYPEFAPRFAAGTPPAALRDTRPAPRTNVGEVRSEIETLHVKGNVYMLVGAGANIAVQIGDDGVMVVDNGVAAMRDKVIAAIRKLSPKPIRWMVNTSGDVDHTGNNEAVSLAGQTLNGNPAGIIAHEDVLARMTATNRGIGERPLNTFFEESRDFAFNGEAVFFYHYPAAHTNGDAFVYFRGSDVIAAGDYFGTTTYPVIDYRINGGVNGFVTGLNKMLSIAVPKVLQDGGTYIIPGHGRVSDEADLVEYRDMIVIIRDRIQDMVNRGMTLEQVRAARPSLDYDGRYGVDGGARFVENVYRILSEKK